MVERQRCIQTALAMLLVAASNLLAFLLLVAMTGAPSSVFAPSSKARSP